jgi:hypothetical protein
MILNPLAPIGSTKTTEKEIKDDGCFIITAPRGVDFSTATSVLHKISQMLLGRLQHDR